MKTISNIALLLMLLLVADYAAAQNTVTQKPPFPQAKRCNIVPGSRMPNQARRQGHAPQGHSNLKALGDTMDILDYSTYNELVANNLAISYYGSLNGNNTQPYANELSSILIPASYDNQDVSYAEVIFDSLAFASYADNSMYSLPLTGSTITLDSISLMMGIWGDTAVNDGTMANDSLVFSIYPVVGGYVSSTPVTTIVKSGYAGLSQFFVGANYLEFFSLGVGQVFNQGEGFAVKMTYLNKDTSSHCDLAYSFADSCGSIVFQGITYESPAYPSPFKGSSCFGELDSTGPGTVSVQNLNNQYFYSLPGIPANCSYVYNQNWQIQAMVSVQVPYSTFIRSSQTTACEGETINLNAAVYGTDSPNITYSWAASAGGVLLGANTATASLTVPANVTNNISVTLTVNDGSGNVADSVVIINCHLNVAPGASQTVCTNSYVALQPVVTGGMPPFSYQWQASAGSLSCTGCADPATTVTQNSVYTVTVTDASQTTATASYSYTVNGTSNTISLSVSNSGITCNGQVETTTVSISGGTGPFTINWGNDSVTSNGGSLVSFPYTAPGGPEIITVSDVNGCTEAYFDTITDVTPEITLAQAIQPGCSNSATGEIIVDVTGGTPPYTYNWGNYPNSDTLSGLLQGFYQLVVTDANACTAIFNYGLNSIFDYNYYVYLYPTQPNCGTPGLITATVNGGVSPFTYSWSDSASTANIQVTATGDYVVTVTDSLGCKASGDAEIFSGCSSIITGTAFYDSSGTCTLAGNPVLANLVVIATDSAGDQYYGYTDINGNYIIYVGNAGTFSLTASNNYQGSCGTYTFCGNTNQTVSLPVVGDSSANNNIGFAGGGGFDLGIHPGWTSANPGFIKQYWVFYYNSSPIPYNGPATVIFNYDSNLTYLYTDETPAPNIDVINHTLTWSVSSVPDINSVNGWSQLDGYFQVPASLSLNYQLQSTFTILPMVGDCDTTDNQYSYSDLVTGSHDPNEKTVSPSGPITADDSVLTYTIHFQNTGTDSTHFVVIKDTLSPNLNPSTVRNIASSDKYSKFDISGNGILTWTFNPLRVVDSATNPSGSKRFIMFTVHKKANLPIGSTISNTASVYFDYNTPVVTNTVRDTEALPTNIFEVTNSNNVSVKAFPNPFNDVTHIVVTGINEKFGFELYDVTGRLQQTIPSIDNSQFDVHKGQLANGVYLYRILVTGKAAAFGKLVVE